MLSAEPLIVSPLSPVVADPGPSVAMGPGTFRLEGFRRGRESASLTVRSEIDAELRSVRKCSDDGLLREEVLLGIVRREPEAFMKVSCKIQTVLRVALEWDRKLCQVKLSCPIWIMTWGRSIGVIGKNDKSAQIATSTSTSTKRTDK
jgi:hypothetical protein